MDYDVLSYGAVGDGRSDDARFIQKAVDEASAAGGGRARVPRP